jgi:ArsR family transcriptional regulator
VAPFVRKVIAVDRSAEMLKAAQARLEGREEVEFRLGDMEALPLADGELDVALLALVLHYLVDPLQALTESFRALKPGGRLVILDMRAHSRTEYESEMGHLWLGFEREQALTWMAEGGFEEGRVVPVPPDPDAEGPSLFIATARKKS